MARNQAAPSAYSDTERSHGSALSANRLQRKRILMRCSLSLWLLIVIIILTKWFLIAPHIKYAEQLEQWTNIASHGRACIHLLPHTYLVGNKLQMSSHWNSWNSDQILHPMDVPASICSHIFSFAWQWEIFLHKHCWWNAYVHTLFQSLFGCDKVRTYCIALHLTSYTRIEVRTLHN